MKRIAFVTYSQQPNIAPDDELVALELRQLGFEVVGAAWDNPDVVWTAFALVVLRSTWDYHTRLEAYQGWLEARAEDGTCLANTVSDVRRNLDKGYLLELQQLGVPVIPFEYVSSRQTCDLVALLQQRGWSEVVVKPAVSASAFGTWRSSIQSAKQDQIQLNSQLEQSSILIQPFVPEIVQTGEWSLVFFAGRYSHAVLKKPAQNDFRVQHQFGGAATHAQASSALIQQAQAVLAAWQTPLLYARVDGIERNGQFLLLELEIHEPVLFLGTATNAKRFAQAIAECVQ